MQAFSQNFLGHLESSWNYAEFSGVFGQQRCLRSCLESKDLGIASSPGIQPFQGVISRSDENPVNQ
jgi:hypothetical protein